MLKFISFRIITSIIGFACFIITANFLGAVNLGKILQILAFINLAGAFAKQGLEQIIIREFSSNDYGKQQFLKFMFEMYVQKVTKALVLTVLIIIAFMMFLQVMSIVLLITMNVIVLAFLGLASEFLRSQNSTYLCQIIPSGLQPLLIFLCSTISMIANHQNFELSFLLSYALMNVIVLLFLMSGLPGETSNEIQPNLNGQKDFLKINILNQSTSSMDIIFIGLVAGDAYVGLYGLFQRFIAPYLLVLSSINGYFGRNFAKNKNNRNALLVTYCKTTVIGGFFGLVISACLYLIIPILISRGNADYLIVNDSTFSLLTTGFVVLATGAGATFLSMVGEQKKYFNFLVLATIGFLGLLIFTGIYAPKENIIMILFLFLIFKAVGSLILTALYLYNNNWIKT